MTDGDVSVVRTTLNLWDSLFALAHDGKSRFCHCCTQWITTNYTPVEIFHRESEGEQDHFLKVLTSAEGIVFASKSERIHIRISPDLQGAQHDVDLFTETLGRAIRERVHCSSGFIKGNHQTRKRSTFGVCKCPLTPSRTRPLSWHSRKMIYQQSRFRMKDELLDLQCPADRMRRVTATATGTASEIKISIGRTARETSVLHLHRLFREMRALIWDIH